MDDPKDKELNKMADFMESQLDSLPDEIKEGADKLIQSQNGISNYHLHMYLCIRAYVYQKLLDSHEENAKMVGAKKEIYAVLDTVVEELGIGLM